MVSGGSFFGGTARGLAREDQKTGQPADGAAGPMSAPQPRRDGKPAAMTFVVDILASLFGFDIVKLNARLNTMEDRKQQVLLVLFTLLADTIRFFLVTCIFVLILY